MKHQILAYRVALLVALLIPALAAAESEPAVQLTLDTSVSTHARNGEQTATGANAPAPALDERAALAQVAEDYRIGPLDMIEISVFQVPELSKTVRVGKRGTISLPLIGEIQAGGLTSLELEREIASKLEASYLQDPQVGVFIKEFVSQRITVEGNVMKSGVFPVSGKTTLLQAIAMAGGLDKLAKQSDIRVFRNHKDGSREILAYDLEPIRKGETLDPVLVPDDLVVVGKSAGRSLFKDVTETLRDLSIFGLFF